MKLSSVAFAGVVFVVCGCSDGEGPEPGSGEVPAGLLDVEGKAEDAYDQALAGDHGAVVTAASSIDASWRGVRAELATDGAAATDLTAMDTAVGNLKSVAAASTDPTTVARAANAISAPMDELFAIYAPSVPPDVLALDYLGREVVLDGMTAVASATPHIDTIQSTWTRVKPALLAAGGQTEATNYEATISGLRAAVTAHDGAAAITHAKAGLEIVDAIEGVFAP